MASDRRLAPASTASGFGQRLRAARQQRGITLQEISQSTKIPVAMLEALENDKPSRLPGGIFSRSFVRSFSLAVGLDPEESLSEFRRAFPEDSAPEDRRADEARQAADGRLWPLLFLVAGAAAVLGLATAWYRGYGPDVWSVWERIQGPPQATLGGTVQPQPATQPAPPAEPPTTAPAPAAPPVSMPAPTIAPQPYTPQAAETQAVQPPPGLAASAQSAPGPAPGAPAAGQPATSTLPPADGLLRLSIQPTGPCWVRVTSDGTVKLSRLVAAGERVDFGAASRIQLEVGDAGAFAYSIGGRPGRSLGESGRVVRVTIGADNVGDFVAR
jgi:cytoskeletal protein RodZ